MENCLSFSPIFNSASIFSGWHEISANYRTEHPVHCKEKKLENFQNFFILQD
jgi:hypothetical protein